MKFYIGNIDHDQFQFLKEHHPTDINFWRPGGRVFRAIPLLAPFLFRLKAPVNKIGGLAFLARSFPLPVSLAWDEFDIQNGVPSLQALRKKIFKYKLEGADRPDMDPLIGCTILTDPVFFEPEDYLDMPSDWARNIVSGKTYDMYSEPGQSLWEAVTELLPKYHGERPSETELENPIPEMAVAEQTEPSYGYSYRGKVRLGQSGFRATVLSIYDFRCAITGESALPTLEAAHIRAHAEKGPHHPQNGILLRADLHKLFDAGYLGLSLDCKLEVSPRLQSAFPNSAAYAGLAGKALSLPKDPRNHPHPEFIHWHRQHKFKS